jgi:hypothetical protein
VLAWGKVYFFGAFVCIPRSHYQAREAAQQTKKDTDNKFKNRYGKSRTDAYVQPIMLKAPFDSSLNVLRRKGKNPSPECPVAVVLTLVFYLSGAGDKASSTHALSCIMSMSTLIRRARNLSSVGINYALHFQPGPTLPVASSLQTQHARTYVHFR